jgi:tRNA threonylcarbamoyladenosine biosynthesis protein TsaB
MRVLGIDTAISTASVALIENEQLIGEEIRGRHTEGNGASRAKGNHAEIILALIEAMLAKACIQASDLSGVGVSIGPGSFTGLRIGLATVKGIAYEAALPVAGVSTLLANAARVTGFDGPICSLLDARKGEVYVGLFRRRGEILSRITADAVTSIGSAIELIRQKNRCDDGASLVVIGDGARAYEKKLRDAFGRKLRLCSGEDYPSVAAQVARFARQQVLAHSSEDIGALVPVYLRRAEAEVKTQFNLSC